MSPDHNRQASNSLAHFTGVAAIAVTILSVMIFDASRDVRSDIDRAVDQIGTACQLEIDQ